ncbi:hypothetical protein [Sphingosinicella sp. BN140058]|uniref:hypothetical protein n=1 Tax=Sphingosinicella sp. BN140058 TaxID=1892855 RepID=UPI001011E2B9|nr:hypothetical protein [Sphingosinicella sp. BN140058]QAY80184.1 hypothetical protein ETR14_26435 [Sphingosinicella sp. BN140058]
MNALSTVMASQRSFASHLGAHCPHGIARLHWAVMNSLGLGPSDLVCSPIELRIFHSIAALSGAQMTRSTVDATITILWNASEVDVLSAAARLLPSRRIAAYNDERQIDGLALRGFEMATACLFDQDSKKVVRIFDSQQPRRLPEYLHVELGEHSDSSLSMYASRIASLR